MGGDTEGKVKIQKLPKFKGLKFIPSEEGKKLYATHFGNTVQAGFPSPADDFKEDKLSLDERFIGDVNSTFFVEVEGYSMQPTLLPQDLLVIKTDKEILHNELGIFSVNNSDYTVKRYDKLNNLLIADNKKFKNIELNDTDTVVCLGVVKNLIRDL